MEMGMEVAVALHGAAVAAEMQSHLVVQEAEAKVVTSETVRAMAEWWELATAVEELAVTHTAALRVVGLGVAMEAVVMVPQAAR